MQHIEFIDKQHFEDKYFRKWALGDLSQYIDFCWETDFESILEDNPAGFTDVLFPNIGYTYMINLGTPFKMQLGPNIFDVKTGGFLPRHETLTAHHFAGNKLFGIKFKVCPIIFEKEVDFSEYKEHIYPLAYLIDNKVVEKVKAASSFQQRIDIVFDHYTTLISKQDESLKYVRTVTGILTKCIQENKYDISIEDAATECNVSTRTLQRYFEATTSFSSKKAIQILRIRKAVDTLTHHPSTFNLSDFGYYDYSHFCKHLQQFLTPQYFKIFQRSYGRSALRKFSPL